MMRTLIERRFLGKFSLSILVFMAACSFQKEKTAEVAESIQLSWEEEMAQLLASGIQQMPSWQSHWKSIDNSFDPNTFQLSKELEYDDLEWPEENFIQQGSPFFPYLIPHPDGLGVVDIYSYKVVIPEDGTVAFNPDSEVIFFKSNGMRQRLLFIGPSGGFQEAVWVSPDYLLVSGFFEYENGVSPMLWLVNIADRSYLEFTCPIRLSQYPKSAYLKEKLKNIPFPQDEAGSDR
jgi:hypothetical protein